MFHLSPSYRRRPICIHPGRANPMVCLFAGRRSALPGQVPQMSRLHPVPQTSRLHCQYCRYFICPSRTADVRSASPRRTNVPSAGSWGVTLWFARFPGNFPSPGGAFGAAVLSHQGEANGPLTLPSRWPGERRVLDSCFRRDDTPTWIAKTNKYSLPSGNRRFIGLIPLRCVAIGFLVVGRWRRIGFRPGNRPG